MIIYIDMDDVVADWHKAAQLLLKRIWNKKTERIPQEEWDSIRQHERFYRDLPVREGADELVQWCLDYAEEYDDVEVRFLTAVPKNNDMPWAFTDKVEWAQEYFPDVPVFFGPFSWNKHEHCNYNDVLIDDRLSNCEDWEAAGGIAYLYDNWPNCKEWLEANLGEF